MLTQTPRGTQDIYGGQADAWRLIEGRLRNVCDTYGMGEIRTPIFEHTELFLRGMGETSDVVEKQMYTFMDLGDRSLTLRPEMTAGAARAYVEHNMHMDVQPTRLYYIGPNFRYEKPQAGRWRQHHQFGVELFGPYGAIGDAEVISLGCEAIKSLGIQDFRLHINSLGGPGCRLNYNNALKNYIKENLNGLCPTCQRRYEKNPLRVLDCKEKACKQIIQDAPSVLDYLGSECRAHFQQLRDLLDAMGISYVVDEKLVRGLDYYTRTVFEFIYTYEHDGTVTELALGGGGRYDNLIQECGGQKTGAIGFGMGIERLLLVMENLDIGFSPARKRTIYVGCAGDEGCLQSQAIVHRLRKKGIAADADTMGRSVKAQMKYADKIHAAYAAIIGSDEILRNAVKIKNMETGEQTEVGLDQIEQFLKDEAK